MTPADEYEALMAEVVRAARAVDQSTTNEGPSRTSLAELHQAINKLDGK